MLARMPEWYGVPELSRLAMAWRDESGSDDVVVSFLENLPDQSRREVIKFSEEVSDPGLREVVMGVR